MYKMEKLPWKEAHNIESNKLRWLVAYKMGLLVYFLINLIYSIVATSVQREQLTYHLVYMFTTLIGLVVVILVTIREYYENRWYNDDSNEYSMHNYNSNFILQSQPHDQRVNNLAQSNWDKGKEVLKNYVIFSLGEILIYPILMCNLYGFINERAWQFDNGISGFNFIFSCTV